MNYFFRLGFSLMLIFAAVYVQAQTLENVRSQLTEDIKKAQKNLSDAETVVSRERAQLSRDLNTIQNRVLDLREKAVSARRLADEETLSLQKMETRVEDWRQQSQYQRRLLVGFLDKVDTGVRSASGVVKTEAISSDNLKSLEQYLIEQQRHLYPQWQSEKIIFSDGEMALANTLQFGPVAWYWQEEKREAGMLSRSPEFARAVLTLKGSDASGIEKLFSGAAGEITIDPTLSRVVALQGNNESVLQHLQKGGIWVVPILLFALFATVIAIAKSISLWRLPKLLPAIAPRIDKAVSDDSAPQVMQNLRQQAQGAQATLIEIALSSNSISQREDRLFAFLLEQRNKLERWLGAIAMTASVSPLLGLLGTVSGMIATFKLMTLFGTGDANSVSAGISEALVTTELGLVVAIPALLAHALMSRKVKSYFAELENTAIQLSQLPVMATNSASSDMPQSEMEPVG